VTLRRLNVAGNVLLLALAAAMLHTLMFFTLR
jgi:hypothetical protein